jgi:hypothetical protein
MLHLALAMSFDQADLRTGTNWGMFALAALMEQHDAKNSVAALKRPPLFAMTHLDFAVDVLAEQVEQVGTMMCTYTPGCTPLRSLRLLCAQDVFERHLVPLTVALLRYPRLDKLELYMTSQTAGALDKVNRLLRANKIPKSLTIWIRGCRDGELGEFGSLLSQNTTLEHLNVGGQALSRERFQHILDVMGSVLDPRTSQSRIQELHLQLPIMSRQGVARLVDALKHNKTLKSLSVMIDLEAASSIVGVLARKQNRTLEELKLQSLDPDTIPDACTGELLKQLYTNDSLKRLELTDYPFEKRLGGTILQLARSNRAFEYIDIVDLMYTNQATETSRMVETQIKVTADKSITVRHWSMENVKKWVKKFK